MQQRAEQFRVEFLKIAENVIKPEMDKYVSRLTALNIRSEAKNTVVVEYCKQEWPFVELTFLREREMNQRTEYHVSFLCTQSELNVEVSVGTYTGLGNTSAYTIPLDEITSVRVSKIINSTVFSAFERLCCHHLKKTENRTEWMVEEIEDLESFTPKREP
jgi:cation transport regulator ChaC